MPGADPKDVLCLEKKLVMSGIRRNDYWPEGEGEHEVTFAYHLITLEVRWFRGHRDAADAWKEKLRQDPQWMTGTVDWVGNDGSVDDLKTGRWPVRAKRNEQLYSYAMPWWLEAGRPVLYKRRLSITQWPRYPLSGLPKRNHGVVTGIGLAAHLSDLQWTLEHPKETNPDAETCRFCECKNNCRAFLKAGITYGRP